MDRVVEMPLTAAVPEVWLNGENLQLDDILPRIVGKISSNGVLSLYLAACAVSGLRGLRRVLMSPVRLMAKDYQGLWLSLLKKPISFLAKAEANAIANTCDSTPRKVARLTTIAATRCVGHLLSAGSSAVLAGLAVLSGSSTFTSYTIAIALASYLIGRAYSASESLPKFMSVLLAGPIFVATLLGRRNSLRYYVQFLLVMCAKYLAADVDTLSEEASPRGLARAVTLGGLCMAAFVKSASVSEGLLRSARKVLYRQKAFLRS